MAMFTRASMMTGQGKPFVQVRIVVPTVEIVTRKTVAVRAVGVVIGDGPECDVAIPALPDVRHFKCDEIFVTTGAVQSLMRTDHEKRLIVVNKNRWCPRGLAMASAAVRTQLRLMGIAMAGIAFTDDRVKLRSGVAPAAGNSVMSSEERKPCSRMIVLDTPFQNLPRFRCMARLAWNVEPFVRQVDPGCIRFDPSVVRSRPTVIVRRRPKKPGNEESHNDDFHGLSNTPSCGSGWHDAHSD